MPEPDWIQDVVQRYERPLVAYAARLLSDLESGRDVVQDCFLKLCAQERTAIEGHLAAWLFTVCRNLALDRLRCRNREIAMDTQDSALAELPAAAAPSACSLEAAEAKAGVLALLATLPERQQEIVRLRFQQGLGYKQIAAVTGLSASNVGFLIHTAIRALQARAPAGLAPDDASPLHLEPVAQ